ncbi:glycogen debranching protein GlgX [Hirschia litorea]|uniref:Glycogen debranching protein GlgX n=1 Tax=Hirschia litorea TaxID=1199156 RepID=A0ABW2II55_9PROT
MNKSDLSSPLGARFTSRGIAFSVWSPEASSMSVCLFDDGDHEVQRLAMVKDGEGVWSAELEGGIAGIRYGYRADGPYAPDRGLWFDPNKLLLDPYATHLDRPFAYDARLAASRDEKIDTAPLMPKAVVCEPFEPIESDRTAFKAGGLIYELQVRSFTKLHKGLPENIRGSVAALGHPKIINHLKKIGVDAVELMPITAWIDERHLGPLGLSNGWGYNPVSYFALDPKLAPGGLKELRIAVEALHKAGIRVFQDVVFNHNGESDMLGPTLSFRGLNSKEYFRTAEDKPDHLINDTGCGNSIDCNHPVVRRLILDSMRHFVQYAGIDGFRFDLGPALGRDDRKGGGFDPKARLINEMLEDDVLKDCVLIAEPWDIGPAGYQLGKFPTRFLEWNDAYRDDVRRFWRGDDFAVGKFATRLCGSSDIFETVGDVTDTNPTRSVNFIAAHDGFSLADMVSYETKHNLANGESNRDGHNENISWNNGVEGATDIVEINSKRRMDIKALLSTLFLSRGTIMLTAGDEFGRTQVGNNNAYAQDNEITWLNWSGRDKQLERHVQGLAEQRAKLGWDVDASFFKEGDILWRRFDGELMTVKDWERPDLDAFAMEITEKNMLILFNRSDRHKTFIWHGATQTISPRTANVIRLKMPK